MARHGRESTSLGRRGAKRQPYDYVLIVCEGEKTEPNYLRELIAIEQLSSANVVIYGDGGSAPINVVNDAIARFEANPEYDRVYCVFDRDSHASYLEALAKLSATTLPKKVGGKRAGEARLEAITSVPCFEYWVLLHFEYTTAPFRNYDALRPRLRQCPGLAGYDKGRLGLYTLLKPRQADALRHADRANAAAVDSKTDNPTTQINRLVRELCALRTGACT